MSESLTFEQRLSEAVSMKPDKIIYSRAKQLMAENSALSFGAARLAVMKADPELSEAYAKGTTYEPKADEEKRPSEILLERSRELVAKHDWTFGRARQHVLATDPQLAQAYHEEF